MNCQWLSLLLVVAGVQRVCGALSIGAPPSPHAHPREMMSSTFVDLFDRINVFEPLAENTTEADAPEVAFAKQMSYRWISKVIDSSWRPNAKAQTRYLVDAFNGIDVVVVSWEVDGRTLRVGQTSSLFAFEIEQPSDNTGTGDHEGRIMQAKEVCTNVFNSVGKRWTSQGDPVEIVGLSAMICSNLFDDGIVYTEKVLSDGYLLGRGKYAAEAHTLEMTRYDDIRNVLDDANNKWLRSDHAWQYWFRNIFWWTDGRRVGFYFLKDEGGPTFGTWSITRDRNWFRILTPEKASTHP